MRAKPLRNYARSASKPSISFAEEPATRRFSGYEKIEMVQGVAQRAMSGVQSKTTMLSVINHFSRPQTVPSIRNKMFRERDLRPIVLGQRGPLLGFNGAGQERQIEHVAKSEIV